MTLNLKVSYPGNDAALPATVELNWDDPSPDNVLPVLAVLLERQPGILSPGMVTEESCRRTLCQHGKGQHGNAGSGGQPVPWGEGYCLRCQSAKCLSFVGAETYGEVDT